MSLNPPPLDRIIARTPMLEVGAFHAPVDHPSFRDSGPIERNIFVFPRTSVSIRHADAEPFVADPTVVTFYNRGQVYSREPVSSRGDRCERFSFDAAVVSQVAEHFDPAVESRPDQPFVFRRGPCDRRSCLLERLVVRHLEGEEATDELLVEEMMLQVLTRILRRGYDAAEVTSASRVPAPRVRRIDVAECVKDLLADRFCEPLSLLDIAEEIGASVGHLARAFKHHTGQTIHRYRDRLRLARALELIDDNGAELLPIALELGYSSHSHFTEAFRRAFGLTPSEYRDSASERHLRRHARLI